MPTMAPPRPQPPQTLTAEPEPTAEATAKIEVRELDFYYGPRRVLEKINIKIRPNQVTALHRREIVLACRPDPWVERQCDKALRARHQKPYHALIFPDDGDVNGTNSVVLDAPHVGPTIESGLDLMAVFHDHSFGREIDRACCSGPDDQAANC